MEKHNPHNPGNERIKSKYFGYLKEAGRQSEASVDGAAKALARFESQNNYREFRKFHCGQATAFKKYLAGQESGITGKKLSKATLHSTLGQLKKFFQWLYGQPGFKPRFQFSDVDYFNLSEKDDRIATTRREKAYPSLDQMKHVLEIMPGATDIERRNRALVAFTVLTGARDGAIASFKVKHVHFETEPGSVFHDAREVKTKFSKSFTTFFKPVGEEFRKTFLDWVRYLHQDKLWGEEDPLFPATEMILGANRVFEVAGIKKEHWSNASPIRRIFQEAFAAAGLPYFNPHSLQNTLAHFGQSICKNAEEYKAWSQNMGHDKVLTTFFNYGVVDTARQGEIIQGLGKPNEAIRSDVAEFTKTLLERGWKSMQADSNGRQD